MKKDLWNKCMYCGKIIGYEEFDKKTAKSEMITPESDVSQERINVYHINCKESANAEQALQT